MHVLALFTLGLAATATIATEEWAMVTYHCGGKDISVSSASTLQECQAKCRDEPGCATVAYSASLCNTGRPCCFLKTACESAEPELIGNTPDDTMIAVRMEMPDCVELNNAQQWRDLINGFYVLDTTLDTCGTGIPSYRKLGGNGFLWAMKTPGFWMGSTVLCSEDNQHKLFYGGDPGITSPLDITKGMFFEMNAQRNGWLAKMGMDAKQCEVCPEGFYKCTKLDGRCITDLYLCDGRSDCWDWDEVAQDYVESWEDEELSMCMTRGCKKPDTWTHIGDDVWWERCPYGKCEYYGKCKE